MAKLEYDIRVSKGSGNWDEASWYVTECLNLAGCLSQGKTEKVALANVRDAIALYNAVIKKHNDSFLPIQQINRGVSSLLNMMIVSGTETVQVLNKVGFRTDETTKLHTCVRSNQPPHKKLTIMNHSKLSPTYITRILGHVGMGEKQFIDLLKSLK